MAVNVIRELLVSLGVNVTPKTKKEIRAYNEQITKLKGQMEDVAQVALRMGTALAGAVVVSWRPRQGPVGANRTQHTCGHPLLARTKVPRRCRQA
jgi:hypothetical protein